MKHWSKEMSSESDGDPVWFWMSDKQLVKGMTREQKWKWQNKASNKENISVSLSVWEYVWVSVYTQHNLLCFWACGIKTLPSFWLCVCVLQRQREHARVCLSKLPLFIQNHRKYHILIKMPGRRKKEAVRKQLASPLLVLHLSVIEQRERMKTE